MHSLLTSNKQRALVCACNKPGWRCLYLFPNLSIFLKEV